MIEHANPVRRRMPLMRSSQGGDRFTNADGPFSLSFRITVLCASCDAKEVVVTPAFVLTDYVQGLAANDPFLLEEHGRAASMVLWRRHCGECDADMNISHAHREQVREMFCTLHADIEDEIAQK
jgi:hypothetical protein